MNETWTESTDQEPLTQQRVEKEVAEAEKLIRTILEKMKKEYTENEERLTKTKEALKLASEEYKICLTRQVELTIVISEQEAILEELIKKRNPSKRYENK